MSRLIRIDDFPHGDKNLWNYDAQNYRDMVTLGLSIFEREGIDYILGVSPGLLQPGDLDFLEGLVKRGRVVLHGHTHGWEREWSTITSCWEKGGEYEGQSVETIKLNYEEGCKTLSKLSCFDEQHYITPFNCYNQEFLDALKDTPVKYIHTCDKEYEGYGLSSLNYHGKTPVVATFLKTYAHASTVIENLHNPSQICLHWIYDYREPTYVEKYEELASLLQ